MWHSCLANSAHLTSRGPPETLPLQTMRASTAGTEKEDAPPVLLDPCRGLLKAVSPVRIEQSFGTIALRSNLAAIDGYSQGSLEGIAPSTRHRSCCSEL